jgi:hypothetical protein
MSTPNQAHVDPETTGSVHEKRHHIVTFLKNKIKLQGLLTTTMTGS